MEKLLELLEQDCTMPVGALAAAAGVSEEEAKKAIKAYEETGPSWAIRPLSTGTASARRR